MKQNGVVCQPGPAFLFFIFQFEYLISGLKVTGTFEKRAPALKVVHSDWSGHFGQSDQNVPFHLTKLLFSILLVCSDLCQVCATGMYRSIGHVEFLKFQTGIFVEQKAPLVIRVRKLSVSGSIQGHYAGNTELKLDSLSFLTLRRLAKSNNFVVGLKVFTTYLALSRVGN